MLQKLEEKEIEAIISPDNIEAIEDANLRMSIIDSEIELLKNALKHVESEDLANQKEYQCIQDRICQLTLERDQIYRTTTWNILGATKAPEKINAYHEKMANFWVPWLHPEDVRMLFSLLGTYAIACHLQRDPRHVLSDGEFGIFDVIEERGDRVYNYEFCGDEEVFLNDGIKAGIFVPGDHGDGCYQFASPEVQNAINGFLNIIYEYRKNKVKPIYFDDVPEQI